LLLHGLQGSQLVVTVPVASAVLRHCFGKLSLSGIRCSKPLRSPVTDKVMLVVKQSAGLL
jgi:hypothetical protein